MTMMTKLLAASATLILACQPVSAQTANVATFPMKNDMIEFVMPSENIECTFVPHQTAIYMPPGGGPELSCDRRDPRYVRVVLGPKGPAKRFDNPGEQPCCGVENIFQYGLSWTGGPFTWRSATTGITCSHENGHGFSMSKERIEVH
jgi:hypothetical protein